MPHLTIEYTDNVDFNSDELLSQMHSALAATGAISLKGLKSRVIRHSEYRIADGNPAYAFVHVGLLIREGRAMNVQQNIAQEIMALLRDTFAKYRENGYISLSVDIKEMRDGIAITDHNIPAVDLNISEKF